MKGNEGFGGWVQRGASSLQAKLSEGRRQDDEWGWKTVLINWGVGGGAGTQVS